MRVASVGPATAEIMIVGEAPNLQEEQMGLPFVGNMGFTLTGMLQDAGISRDAVYITNVVKDRPAGNDISIWINKRKKPKQDEVQWNGMVVKGFILDEIRRLEQEIKKVKPKVIIAMGNIALWALTGQPSVDKWRGSHMRTRADLGHDCYVMPTYHPTSIQRVHAWKYIATADLRRALRLTHTPLGADTDNWKCLIKPTFDEAKAWLTELWQTLEKQPVELVCDLEIKEYRIVCMGLTWRDKEAMCIPFLTNNGFYWSVEEEVAIVEMFRAIVYHPNCRLCNQNIGFDIQFLWKEWMVWPPIYFDTMIAQAVIFPGTPASLDYLSSMYCDYYLYWKDDGKFWKEFVEDERLWRYNCYDGIYTYEVMQAQKRTLQSLKKSNQARTQFRILNHVVTMMHEGVRVDKNLKGKLMAELIGVIETLKWELEYLCGESLWAEKGFSNKKLADFFYGTLKMPLVLNPKTKSPTCDDEALKKFAKSNYYLKPICERINIIRSYGTAVSVCLAKVDPDGRWRCSYRVAGTETLRFTSSENPMNSGTNLQNITLGKDILGET